MIMSDHYSVPPIHSGHTTCTTNQFHMYDCITWVILEQVGNIDSNRELILGHVIYQDILETFFS